MIMIDILKGLGNYANDSVHSHRQGVKSSPKGRKSTSFIINDDENVDDLHEQNVKSSLQSKNKPHQVG